MAGGSDPLRNSRSAKAERLVMPPVDSRGEAMRRLQIGVVGLAAMLLMVALANVVTERAKQSDAGTVAESVDAQAAPGEQANEGPLVDAGVLPNLPSEKDDDAAEPSGRMQGNARTR